MGWTLIILMFGYSGGPAIDASMHFRTQAACERASQSVSVALKAQGYRPAFVSCVATESRS